MLRCSVFRNVHTRNKYGVVTFVDGPRIAETPAVIHCHITNTCIIVLHKAGSGSVCDTGTSLVSSKPYCHFFSGTSYLYIAELVQMTVHAWYMKTYATIQLRERDFFNWEGSKTTVSDRHQIRVRVSSRVRVVVRFGSLSENAPETVCRLGSIRMHVGALSAPTDSFSVSGKRDPLTGKRHRGKG